MLQCLPTGVCLFTSFFFLVLICCQAVQFGQRLGVTCYVVALLAALAVVRYGYVDEFVQQPRNIQFMLMFGKHDDLIRVFRQVLVRKFNDNPLLNIGLRRKISQAHITLQGNRPGDVKLQDHHVLLFE